MGWRAYPDLSFLSASLLHLSFITCALSLSSSHFICHLSPNSSVSPPLIHGLRHHVSFSLCSFFPSALIKHNEWEILHWKPGRARDIYPDLAGQDGEDYKYYICLAVNIFIRGWIITWLRMCLQKHVCLDVPALKRWAVTKTTFDGGLASQLTRRLFTQS